MAHRHVNDVVLAYLCLHLHVSTTPLYLAQRLPPEPP